MLILIEFILTFLDARRLVVVPARAHRVVRHPRR